MQRDNSDGADEPKLRQKMFQLDEDFASATYPAVHIAAHSVQRLR